jgi:hypothetical protein
MDVSVQDAIQELITALVRSLGPGHGKLLTLMRTFPPGAETLALRILNIFTEQGRPNSQLVALVRGLLAERDLDARFLIPIIAEMDKPDIVKHLPRIVSILNGTQETKELVRSVFGAVVTTPPQTFGSVTSNLPRVRQSELLTPAELMVLLHDTEKEIGIKSAIEGTCVVVKGSRLQRFLPVAIGICFSMTDVFRSEILAVVMQQILDELVLPTLFMRTVSPEWFSVSPVDIHTCIQGDSSSQDIQVTYRFCLSNIALTTNHEKDLDNTAALGGFHSLCGDRRALEFPSAVTTPERTTTGTSGQAATPARTTSRVCTEKGW